MTEPTHPPVDRHGPDTVAGEEEQDREAQYKLEDTKLDLLLRLYPAESTISLTSNPPQEAKVVGHQMMKVGGRPRAALIVVDPRNAERRLFVDHTGTLLSFGHDRGSNETYGEHVEWAKKRALAQIAAGEHLLALDSLVADLLKHPMLEQEARQAARDALEMRGLARFFPNPKDDAAWKPIIEHYIKNYKVDWRKRLE